ncbi:type I-F CRISPR-associated endonuclease Cas1f [Mitsuokella multacida]|uniref:type I-F CRISPR-associated endonuclease Cas1f n=1 Tax=Mitsuokella multacida TaxID=52226 RepID=UPI0026DDA973|nr:type I-F CRISPR-associated endonuclease Cas1f [Mitsuokella multacida]
MTKSEIEASNLKVILHSKRANIYYLEKCRVMQKDGRVLYLTEGKRENQYWNIPIANTTVLLLGTGTSITQAAMRMLAMAGVMVGFCGNGGTPLLSGVEIEWLNPQSEYRPTEYVQGWLSFWFQADKRLAAAKEFQLKRCQFIEQVWQKDRDLQSWGFYADDDDIESAMHRFRQVIQQAVDIKQLLAGEAIFTKALYKYASGHVNMPDFVRLHDAPAGDKANIFLNHGNYLAYGLAAVTLWVLGIPHGFAVMHGKTRRGALVFDVADLVKDAIVLPGAFICAEDDFRDQEFRSYCLQKFTEHKVLDFLFEEVKRVSQLWGKEGPYHDGTVYQSQ